MYRKKETATCLSAENQACWRVITAANKRSDVVMILKGKRILVTGALNTRSLATGIAQAAVAEGAELYLTYQNERAERGAAKLQALLGAEAIHECDVSCDNSLDALGAWVKTIGPIDGLVHSIANAKGEELQGPYLTSTTRAGFMHAIDVSAWSLTALSQRVVPHMNPGGSIITLSFCATQQVWANYNAMGIAKAALEASVRTLAVDLGPLGIRVNGVSASAAKTAAASGIGDRERVGGISEAKSPIGRLARNDEVGNVGAFLLSDKSSCILGQVISANCGIEITAHPPPWNAALMQQEMGLVAEVDFAPVGSDREGVELNIAKPKNR